MTAYLADVLAVNLRLEPCVHVPLPVFLANSYAFCCGVLLELPCVFANPHPPYTPTPAQAAKQARMIEDSFGRACVLVYQSLSARDRRRLIEHRVSFVVPHAQAYLPPLGVDFRDRLRKSLESKRRSPTFAPTTQMALLHMLLTPWADDVRALELAAALDVSPMSISRALQELESVGLLERPRVGRERRARLALEPRKVWTESQPYLTSPVVRRYVVPEGPLMTACEAGLTALARISSLAAPRWRTVAMHSRDWKGGRGLIATEYRGIEPVEDGCMVIEVWKYPPKVLSNGPTVDPLSLSLSLRGDEDERVQAAIEEVVEALWK